jgi:DNA-binding transcriptional LysR family regulator
MLTQTNLDLDTLRTFSVAHDLGGLAQAAEALGRTPSAISLQMKRLQDDVGTPLLRKRGRGLALTEAGVVALTFVRRILALNDELLDTMQGTNLAGHIRLGCTQDFTSILPSVLSRFASVYPRMQIELHVEGNAALADAVDRSKIDLAVVIGHENRAMAKTIGLLDLVWIASSTFVPSREQSLPLATLGPQCAFRKYAVQRLEAASIAFRVAVNSPSLDGLWAALLGGLGITVRTAFNLPEGLIYSRSLFKLPSLGQMPVCLHRNANCSGVAISRMESLLIDGIKSMLANPLDKLLPHALNGGIATTGKPKRRSSIR